MAIRLVAIGTKVPAFRTRTLRVDNRFGQNSEVIAAGLPQWTPQEKPTRFPKPDQDLIRKQRIEDAIARGDDSDA